MRTLASGVIAWSHPVHLIDCPNGVRGALLPPCITGLREHVQQQLEFEDKQQKQWRELLAVFERVPAD